MLKMNLQFFAHKKGVGSTKNGRDSESKRLRSEESRRTVCKSWQYPLQTAWYKDSPRCECWYAAAMILYLHWLTVL